MRALQLQAFDGPQALVMTDVPNPTPAEGHSIVRAHAIGINFPDLLATKGSYQALAPLPFTPGCEIAGVVEQTSSTSAWRVGDRVAAFVWQGGYADRVSVPDDAMMLLPADASFEDGAGLVVNYQTVHFALSRRGRLEPDESVLVLGAGGGIGSAALQVARGLGATTIAGVATAAQAEVAIAAGANDVIMLDKGFSAALLDLTDGRGVDVVLDPLGDWIFSEALRCLAPEGRILVLGFAAGAIPEVRVNRLLLRNASAIGVAWGAFIGHDPGIVGDAARALGRFWDAGIVRPAISRTGAFEDIPDLLEQLDAGRIAGKAVVKVSHVPPSLPSGVPEGAT